MNNPVLTIAIDGIVLPMDKVSDFEFECSILDGKLPRGSFILNDTGIYLEKLRLRLGSQIILSIIEGNSNPNGQVKDQESSLGGITKDQMNFCSFVLSDVTHSLEKSSSFANRAKINFTHPWLFYSDMKNHAYSAKVISELIKQVIRESERGILIEVDESNFDSTNDSGMQTRYKYGESDYDFIMNKLVPYAQVNSKPAYFYIDEIGRVFLKSYNSLYTQSSSATLVFTGEVGANRFPVSMIEPGELSIGLDEDSNSMFNRLKIELYAEELAIKKFVSGIKSPTTKIGDKENGSVMPILQNTMAGIRNTDIVLFNNKSAEDQYSLLNYYQRDLEQLFTFDVATTFVGDKVQLGQPVDIETGYVGEKSHWLNGKWIVGKIRHERKSAFDEISTQLTLIRPTFQTTEQTTLENPELLYQIV